MRSSCLCLLNTRTKCIHFPLNVHVFFFFLSSSFLKNRVSPCGPGCPGTCSMDMLPPRAGTKGVCHHMILFFLDWLLLLPKLASLSNLLQPPKWLRLQAHYPCTCLWLLFLFLFLFETGCHKSQAGLKLTIQRLILTSAPSTYQPS